VNGQPRPADQVAQLGEAAKKAVGIDLARGDQFEISSAVFARPEEPKVVERTFLPKGLKTWQIAAALLLLLLVALVVQRRRRQLAAARESEATDIELLRPGAKVGDIEAQLGEVGLGGADALSANAPPPVLVDPAVAARDRARELAQNDPVRATQILRAWMNGDAEAAQAAAPQTQRAGENG
jgi:flagellar M-ring protein FliF